MTGWDFGVLGGYFLILIIIGVISSRFIKKQEDYFMGGRGFGKLLQTFAAFGAGTGAHDPILMGRTTWTSGLTGIWSVLVWLFITPFYWIFAVWYRRMRHLTLGDWFVERYESKPMGVAYALFGFVFQILYLSIMFSAISKVSEPLLGDTAVGFLVGMVGSQNPEDLKWVLIPIIAFVVIAYGVLGGLTAAYWTDLIQGICIIGLSVILIPAGLYGLVSTYGNQYEVVETGEPVVEAMDGFSIMHERLPEAFFQLFGGPRAGEFPIHYIVSLTLLALVGIVVQPHFIATGGGSAKTEFAARMGLVTGNFLKRLCTIGWAITGLIVLALLAGNIDAARDPDVVWGIASRELLGSVMPGLVGLMLACLLAALMSSADCYMLVASALFVRNIYAPYVDPDASEKTYVTIGRISGAVIVAAAAAVAISSYNVFEQYKIALEVTAVFAAPFWLGMHWRWANKWSAWLTIAFSLCFFYIIPAVLPMAMPYAGIDLRGNEEYAVATNLVTTTTTRSATHADVDKRQALITAWEEDNQALQEQLATLKSAQQAVSDALAADDWQSSSHFLDKLGDEAKLLAAQSREMQANLGAKPTPIVVGESFEDKSTIGGEAIFWRDGLDPVRDAPDDEWAYAGAAEPIKTEPVGKAEEFETANGDKVTVTTTRNVGQFRGKGWFRLDFLLYHWAGVDLSNMSRASIQTLRLPPRVLLPFIVMILLSLITPKNSKKTLDRYYAKMKTPVDGDPEVDKTNLAAVYADPDSAVRKRLFPFFGLEIQRPTWADIIGFVVSFVICFAFLGFAWWLANLGAQ